MLLQIDEVDKIVERLNKIEQMYGIGGMLIVVTFSIVLILSWKYLVKRTELIAYEASEELLKKFQANLDKELVKFQTKHQKQVDAIHDTFQKFQRMTSTINFMMNGGKFTSNLKPDEEISALIKFRHDFKQTYFQNKLIFPKQLCEKIEGVFPTIDDFIETYVGGIFPEQSEEEKEFNSQQNGGLYLAGVWGSEEFDEVLAQLEKISIDIESEFRKIYGTND